MRNLDKLQTIRPDSLVVVELKHGFSGPNQLSGRPYRALQIATTYLIPVYP
jgi:hypothetical protein